MDTSDDMVRVIMDKAVNHTQLGSDLGGRPELEIEERFQRNESDLFVITMKLNGNSSRLYVKVGKEHNFEPGTLLDRLSAEYNCLGATYEFFKDQPKCAAVRPIAFVPECRAIVTAEVPGEGLKDLVVKRTQRLSGRPVEDIRNAIFLCGQWLRDFHQNIHSGTQFEMEAVTIYVTQRLELLEAGALIPETVGARLRERLEDIERGIGPSLQQVQLHNDFIPGNVLFDGHKICVLDFSWVGRGCKYFDIVAFWLELQRLSEMPHYSTTKVEHLQNAFLNGYGGISEHSTEFRLFELVHRVNLLDVHGGLHGRARWWHRRMVNSYEMGNHVKWLANYSRGRVSHGEET